MKKIHKISLLICFLCVSTFSLKAQYLTGIGASLGLYARGVTVIQYFSPKARGAADFILASQSEGVTFTGLYEIHNPNHNERIELANVGFFAGLGGHAGMVNPETYGRHRDTKNQLIFVVGVDLIAGAEWKLPRMPLLLSVNAKPFLDLNLLKDQLDNYDFFDAAITLRYLF